MKRNPWIACLVLMAAASGTVTIAGTGFQSAAQSNPQQQQQQTDEQRGQVPEEFLQDLQKNAGSEAPAQNPAPPATPFPAAAQRVIAAGDQIKLNFDNLPIYDLVNQMADMLNISPIMIEPDIKGSVTFHSTAPVSIQQDVLPIFNLILKSNNAALVKSGVIYKVVPISQGLKEGLELVVSLPPVPPAKPAADKEAQKKTEATSGDTTKAPTPTGAQQAGAPPSVPPQAPSQPPANPSAQSTQTVTIPHLVTEVIRVEFVPVATLVEPLRLFMTEGGVIMPYDRQNMLIITDYSDSIQKLLEVVHLLDNSYLDSDLIELVEIKYNAAADILDDLKKIFGTGVSMISLDRINTIMVMANSKRALEEVKRWIAKFDTTTGRSVQTFIYTVENGTASNIAQVLGLLFGGGEAGTTPAGVGGASGTNQRGTGTSPSGSTQSGNRSITSTQSANMNQGLNAQNPYGAGAGMTGFGNPGGIIGGQQSGIGGPRLNQQAGMSSQVLSASQFSGLQGSVRIVADDINNSLIVQGSPADYAFLLDTIKRMDVLPRQAIIEARIFEIDLTNDLSFGVSATLQALQTGQHLTTGGIDGSTGALSAASFAFVGASREILMNLNALRQKTKVKILEAPAVLAIDGQTAHIQVGGQVPVPGFSYVGAAGGATTSVSYANTGTELEITPRISASGTVTLQVSQSVTSEGNASALGPTFNTTNVITTLAVKDGESVAIAGLIRENESSGRNGVPILSDIPVLGVLFGRTTRNTNRSELLIMITPHVIRTPERFQQLTEQLKDSLRNVGKYADQKQQEIKKDQEKSQKDRLNSQDKPIKKSDQSVNPPAPIKKSDKSANPPAPIKKESEPVAYSALQPRRDRA
jgi:type II secretion system protein D